MDGTLTDELTGMTGNMVVVNGGNVCPIPAWRWYAPDVTSVVQLSTKHE